MISARNPEYMNIELTVNGESIAKSVPTHMRLLDFLRDELQLTGSKECCGEGECGTCTVLLDGVPVTSCLIFAVEADGHEIVTVEGLDKFGEAREIFASYVDNHAVQCGFCTPGMVVSTFDLLKHNPQPDRDEIRYALAGNLCRCTGYAKIIDAVQAIGKAQ